MTTFEREKFLSDIQEMVTQGIVASKAVDSNTWSEVKKEVSEIKKDIKALDRWKTRVGGIAFGVLLLSTAMTGMFIYIFNSTVSNIENAQKEMKDTLAQITSITIKR